MSSPLSVGAVTPVHPSWDFSIAPSSHQTRSRYVSLRTLERVAGRTRMMPLPITRWGQVPELV